MRGRDLRITYYGYNGFIIEADEHKIAVDPGANLYIFDLGPVIPRKEWRDVTHVVVTHADPDHYWHADRVAAASGAPIICGSELVERREGKSYIVYPRSGKARYDTEVARVYPMNVGDAAHIDGVHFRALPAFHGDLKISLLFGLIMKTVKREPGELFAMGEMGVLMDVGGVRIANLGDSVFRPEWARMEPDILMVPIGGGAIKNTMDEADALRAVEMIRPSLVIPCHYNCGILFRKRGNPADAESFKRRVERLDIGCAVLELGESLTYGRAEGRAA